LGRDGEPFFLARTVQCRIKYATSISIQANPISAWQGEKQIGTIPESEGMGIINCYASRILRQNHISLDEIKQLAIRRGHRKHRVGGACKGVGIRYVKFSRDCPGFYIGGEPAFARSTYPHFEQEKRPPSGWCVLFLA
jgi:hypothetical protein